MVVLSRVSARALRRLWRNVLPALVGAQLLAFSPTPPTPTPPSAAASDSSLLPLHPPSHLGEGASTGMAEGGVEVPRGGLGERERVGEAEEGRGGASSFWGMLRGGCLCVCVCVCWVRRGRIESNLIHSNLTSPRRTSPHRTQYIVMQLDLT